MLKKKTAEHCANKTFAFRWKKKHRTPKMTNQRRRNAIVINNTLESVLSQSFIYHIKTKHRRYELVAIISTFHSMDIDFITTLKQFSIYIHGIQWANITFKWANITRWNESDFEIDLSEILSLKLNWNEKKNIANETYVPANFHRVWHLLAMGCRVSVCIRFDNVWYSVAHTCTHAVNEQWIKSAVPYSMCVVHS